MMTTTILGRAFRSASVLAFSLVAACGQVLGIEDALVDPTFTTSGEASVVPPSCSAYCDEMASSCGDQQSQYADEFQCLAVCNHLPAGTLGDPTGNTVSCRLARAAAAATASENDLEFFCREAGPGGDGACGAPCESFCSLMMAVCPPTHTAFSYPDVDACLGDCEALPQVPYAYGDQVLSGNTVQCRTFYAGFAAQGASAECERARGVSVCVDPSSEAPPPAE